MPPLRVGVHTWPGYELLHLGQALGAMDAERVRLVQTTSASASLRGIRAGALDGACLTLDEVLSLEEAGQPMAVVALVDFSDGADVVVGGPKINSLNDLRGRRIGVENSAVGAVLLDAALQKAGLEPRELAVHFLTIDEHETALRQGAVDALVTYDPVRTRLVRDGYRELFSSREVPGLIADVIAVRREMVRARPDAVRACVVGFLRGVTAWQTEPQRHLEFLGKRLGLPPEGVPQAFAGIQIADLALNRQWLGGDPPALRGTAERVARAMRHAGLLRMDGLPQGLFEARFLDGD